MPLSFRGQNRGAVRSFRNNSLKTLWKTVGFPRITWASIDEFTAGELLAWKCETGYAASDCEAGGITEVGRLP